MLAWSGRIHLKASVAGNVAVGRIVIVVEQISCRLEYLGLDCDTNFLHDCKCNVGKRWGECSSRQTVLNIKCVCVISADVNFQCLVQPSISYQIWFKTTLLAENFELEKWFEIILLFVSVL